MPPIDPMQSEPLLTRREVAAILSCSMRTVSRRIEDGTLRTAYRSNGQRGILAESVNALVMADQTLASDALGGSQGYATDPLPQAMALAAAYGALAQAVMVHLDAGILTRRATREQLRVALERSSASVEPLLQSGGTVETPVTMLEALPIPS
jgi:hypothetical protein